MLKSLIFLIFLYAYSLSAFSQIDITLRKSFVDSIKNSIIFEAEFQIVKAHKHPNPGAKDGDMHIAGMERTIGLPVISEIMNAGSETEAVDMVHLNESGTSIPLNGVWRIWCEHPGHDEQVQGEDFPEITNTNPDHVFEIHPVTEIGDINLLGSLRKIQGYRYKEAFDAFSRYSDLPCKLLDLGNKIQIETKGIGYNYVDFSIELISAQTIVEDGRFIQCNVLDRNDDLVATNIRMVFPKGSDAEEKVKSLSSNEILHVIGIPRINLDLVSFRINTAEENPGILEWNLPYEIIIVAAP